MRIKVVSVPELADKSGKTVTDLAESSDTQGMLQVILEEKESLGKTKLLEDKDKDVAEKADLMKEVDGNIDTVAAQVGVHCRTGFSLKECNVKQIGAILFSAQIMLLLQIPTVEDMEGENVEDKNCDEVEKVGAGRNDETNSVINEALDTSDIVLEQPEGIKGNMAPLHGRGSISPDGNKENVQTNNTSGEDTESDSEKGPVVKEETLRMKSPFTALNPKQKKNLSSGGGTSRGAMLLNLSRYISYNISLE